ncbi:MAG: pilus assembly protein N-terminal domain-containing protein [Candidatus Korobacteraceae bacterium]|jgi:pilus assembly protein CpaC
MKPLSGWNFAWALIAVLLAAGVLDAQSPAAANAAQSAAVSPAANQAPPSSPSPTEALPGAGDASAATSTQRHVAPLALKAAATAAAAGDKAPTVAASGTKPPSDAQGTRKLHLIVGRSLFLNFPERLRRVYVSNPVVLDSIASSPFELVITARAAGTSSLVLWSTGGQTQMYTVLADVDVAGLRESLADALPGDHVEVEAQQGRVHLSGVVGSDAAADEAARLAGVYSKDVINSLVVDPGHLPQVQLQVRIAEVDRSKLTAFGINLFGLNGNSIGQGSTEQFSPFTFQPNGSTTQAITSDFLNLFYFDVKNGIGATIKDLQTKGVLQILAEPNLTTLHGKTARFLAGGEFPYPIVQPGGAGSVPTVTVQFRPYGVKLEFTPFVNSDGTIRLKVAPEVSALDYTNEVVIAGYALPALSTRKAETEVELKDGQSFGISGILDNRITDTLSKMPGIANIPVLGVLFRSKNLNHSTMELVVIVTPKIIDSLNAPGLPPPSTPEMPVPFLQPQAFDSTLPKN